MTASPPPPVTSAPLAQVRQLLRTLRAPDDACAMFDALCADIKLRTGASTLEDIRSVPDPSGNPVLEMRGVSLGAGFVPVRPYDNQPWTCVRDARSAQPSSPWTKGNTPGRM